MGLTDRLHPNREPNASRVTQYAHLPEFVERIRNEHRDILQEALKKHPILHTAWTVIQDSAHPDYIPENSDLDAARKLMVNDLASAIKTGTLTQIV
ncbi:hypothetical protein COU75_02530 [Candidatus Peregrinibacteria bacterium CG10_big_fil_rev_8_21_14_0_10_42_8]|nr:MAG: hypothetical protein COU75_02530 [Candidatus Peregrinibacteria bacterium CG10_big_fil_rev_8_21_14_0_10_42_8]